MADPSGCREPDVRFSNKWTDLPAHLVNSHVWMPYLEVVLQPEASCCLLSRTCCASQPSMSLRSNIIVTGSLFHCKAFSSDFAAQQQPLRSCGEQFRLTPGDRRPRCFANTSMEFSRLCHTRRHQAASTSPAEMRKVSSTSSGRSPPSSFMPELLQPLRVHMLIHVPVKVLPALRQACSLTRSLVNDGTCPQWLAIAQQLHVPKQLLPHAAQHGPAVHAVLRDQAVLVTNIRQGRPSLVHRGELGQCTFTSLSWVLQRSGVPACQMPTQKHLPCHAG